MTQWRPQASRSSHVSLGEQQYRSADSNPGSPQMSGLSYDHQRRRPVYPYIPAHRAHSSDAFTGYSEPLVGSSHVPVRGLYSQTQFDTLSILSRVHNRPNPKIELGPVDDSVSFVVVDATQDDFPVVYCSQNFHRLTGYRREEIMGRNCRFLQHPPPDVPSGQISRAGPRSPAVDAFKHSLTLGQECQASLVNYRRDGEPFLNLISVIPIRWEENDGQQKEYYVGFQVDLEEALSRNHHAGIPESASIDSDVGRGPGDELWAET